MDILKRIMKPVKEDIFHSSAYGKAQNSGLMGTASTRSFSDRMKVERGRTMIKGYGSSSVAGSGIGNGPRAKTFTPPTRNDGSGLRPVPPRMRSIPVPPRNPGNSR